MHSAMTTTGVNEAMKIELRGPGASTKKIRVDINITNVYSVVAQMEEQSKFFKPFSGKKLRFTN